MYGRIGRMTANPGELERIAGTEPRRETEPVGGHGLVTA